MMQIVTAIAKVSNDLKNAGAYEAAYNAGRIVGFLLVAGVILLLSNIAIKKVLSSSGNSKMTDKHKEKRGREMSVSKIKLRQAVIYG